MIHNHPNHRHHRRRYTPTPHSSTNGQQIHNTTHLHKSANRFTTREVRDICTDHHTPLQIATYHHHRRTHATIPTHHTDVSMMQQHRSTTLLSAAPPHKHQIAITQTPPLDLQSHSHLNHHRHYQHHMIVATTTTYNSKKPRSHLKRFASPTDLTDLIRDCVRQNRTRDNEAAPHVTLLGPEATCDGGCGVRLLHDSSLRLCHFPTERDR
ncbi:Hypothetical predicted protein [Olea europaea subsp. europaea]|uniref:Uncharacterized protein n=1 Tax=Olea europaea subsp. europaea TaxID=158383 RepID=A0A8S0U5F3_OLEEU|nr:Hypothetical predicted protein [Olea europaea subsp. europaea]